MQWYARRINHYHVTTTWTCEKIVTPIPKFQLLNVEVCGSSQFTIQTQTFYELFISSAALRWDLNTASCSGLSASSGTFNI